MNCQGEQPIGLAQRFWQILEGAGWAVMNHRDGHATREELLTLLRLDLPLPYVPTGSQTVRIVGKGQDWFFIYAHASSTEHGFWGFSANVFDQIRGQEIINWVMVFLKENETEGWWAEPDNVRQLVRHQDWTPTNDGRYILNYPRGIGGGCVPFHSREELLGLMDTFASKSRRG